MSYESTTMRLMGGVPGQQLFLYRSPDSAASVGGSGYFNNAIADYNLSSGDIVLAVSGFGVLAVLAALVVTVNGGNATASPLA